MENSSWRKVLFEWINCTGFTKTTTDNLDETDIEEFFIQFKRHLTAKPLLVSNVIEFVQVQYPLFDIHYDDENKLSSLEYVYIYSLFLHYSCVKCPEPYFHTTCNGLNNTYQSSIASFFGIILNSSHIDRETLRSAISDTAPKSPVQIYIDSPIRTPKLKLSPPTPRTIVIEEKSRELKLLKAQLDGERYERGFLEIQIKQNDEKINKLVALQKKNVGEIHDLKNELLLKNTENFSPNRTIKEDQIKKRLRKQISEKDELIIKLETLIDSLTEEKTLVNDKLTYTNNELSLCAERIKQLNVSLDETKTELDNQCDLVKFLQENNSELQNYLREMRLTSNKHIDFNTSSECLDVSFTRAINNSSTSSPENLGLSVIDLQLKEKEKENCMLQILVNDLRQINEQVLVNIKHFSEQFPNVFKINQVESEMESPLYVEMFITDVKNFFKNSTNLQGQFECISKSNEILLKEKLIYEQHMQTQKEELKKLQSLINDISVEKAEWIKQDLEYQKDIKLLKDKIEKFRNDVKIFTDDKNMSIETEKSLNLKINELKIIIDKANIQLFDLNVEKDKQHIQIETLTSEIVKHEKQNSCLETDLKDLKSQCSDLVKSNSILLKEKEALGKVVKVCKLEIESLRTSNEEISSLKEIQKEKEDIIEVLQNQSVDFNGVIQLNQKEIQILQQNIGQLMQEKDQLIEAKIESDELTKGLRLELKTITDSFNNYKISDENLKAELLVKNENNQSKLNEMGKKNRSLQLANELLIDENNLVKSKLEITEEKSTSNEADLKRIDCELRISKSNLEERLLISEEAVVKLTEELSKKNEADEIQKEKIKGMEELILNHENEIVKLRGQEVRLFEANKMINYVEEEKGKLLLIVTKLEKETQKYDQTVEEQRLKVKQLMEELQEMKSIEQEFHLENRVLENKIDNFQKVNTSLEKSIKSLELKFREQNKAYETSESYRKDFDIIVSELKNYLQMSENKCVEIETKKSEIEGKFKTLEEKCIIDQSINQKSFDQLKDYEITTKNLEIKLNACSVLYNDSQNKLSETKQILNDVEQNYETLGVEKAMLNKMVENLKRDLNDQVQKSSGVSDKLNKIMNDICETEDRAKTVKDMIDEMVQKKSMTSTKISILSDIPIEKLSLDDKLEILEDRILNLQTEKWNLTKNYEELQRQYDKLDIELTEVKATNESNVFQLNKTRIDSERILTEKIDFNLIKSQEIELKYENLLKDSHILQSLKSDLEEQLKHSEEGKGLIELENTEIRSEHLKICHQIVNLEETVKLKENELVEIVEERDTLNLLVEKNSLMVKDLETEIETYQNEKNLNESNLQELLSRVETLTNKTLDLELKQEELTSKLSTIKEDKTILNSKLKHMETINHELEIKLEDLIKSTDQLNDELKLKDFKLKQLSTDMSQQKSVASVKDDNLIATLQRERDAKDKLAQDVSILHAKLYKHRQLSEEKEKEWLKEKNKLLAACAEQKSFEERIKDNRLELEGKLEKMKAKMKSLYSEEIAKIKLKHEREIVEYRVGEQQNNKKVEQYDLHVQKLSKQLFQMNETQLELKKDNEMMKTKIRFMENNHTATGKRNLLQPNQQLIGSNLKMEDEEGEIFNNTYLMDLKTGGGRFSPDRRDSVMLPELQYRNSMNLPHLRSTYMAQYGDQELREEDIKDSINFDDSLSSLLSGQRKKLGTTSYKRPGPPTPSKNAGRLSFGSGICSSDYGLPREILKEHNDNTMSKKSTPGKIMSLFSSSRVKDENGTPKRRLSIFKNKK